MRRHPLTLLTCLLFLSPNVMLIHTPNFIEYKKTYFGGETETVELDTLINCEGFFYKKFREVPFSGKINRRIQGTFKNSKQDGEWVAYYKSGEA